MALNFPTPFITGPRLIDGNDLNRQFANPTLSTQTSIVATAGGGKTNAQLITAALNNITTVATSADSIKLPPSAPGKTVMVTNSGASSMQVFGSGTDTINGVATGTGIAQAAGSTIYYECVVLGNWIGGSATSGTYTGTFDGVIGGNTPAAGTFTTLTTSSTITGGASSNIAINTNKFTVAASSGNTLVAGTLAVTGITTLTDDLIGGASTDIAINTNKFTVAATSGNTVVAGTLGVTGLATLTAGASSADNITMTAINKGVILKQGANGRVGTFVANGTTTVTISNTSIAIADAIIISLNTVGGTVGVIPKITTITAATGFTVVCTASDTSTYNYTCIGNAA